MDLFNPFWEIKANFNRENILEGGGGVNWVLKFFSQS